MARNEDLRTDDIKRRENPDKSRQHPDQGDEDRNVNEERKRGERGTEHDKEDIEKENE